MGKTVVIGAEARNLMLEGVNILTDAVKATLGPRGRNAAIAMAYGPPLITKDGVTVARYISLDDKAQDMGAQLIKSVAAEANNAAGDGTTTATILAQAIYSGGLKSVVSGSNPVLIKRGIDIATRCVVNHLNEIKIDIADAETMKHVATISVNNDKELGEMIAGAVAAVGNDGIISVEEATGSSTHVEYVEGMKLDRGLLSDVFITNPQKLAAELDNCLILTYGDKINSIHEIVDLLTAVSQSGRNLLIIARDFENETLSQIIYNKAKGALNCCAIKAPGFGDTRKAMLQDIAVLTGGKFFSNEDGRGLRDAVSDDLGSARKVVVGLNSTMIIDGNADQESIKNRIEEIKAQMSQGDLFGHQEGTLRLRVSRLTGGVAVFKVGGISESEMKEKKDRVEDAINAVKSALEEGVVTGGGSALLRCIPALDAIDTTNLLDEEIVGISIVRDSMKIPFIQILTNAGVRESAFGHIARIVESDNDLGGFDALRLEYVDDMMERGILDPVKVVRCALEHAASASGTLLTTEVSIFDSVPKE